MRIISKFRDFYDTAMGLGMDLELIYLRKKEVIKGYIGPSAGTTWYMNKGELRYISHNVGFCGKLYGCVQLVYEPFSVTVEKPKKEIFCYDIEAIDKFIEANFKKKQIESYTAKPRWRRWRNASTNLGIYRGTFVEYFKKCEEAEDKYTEFFIKHHVPIFVENGGKITLNANLKDIQFFKKFDPYTAFQELHMYLGGLASPEKPIPHISDADMLEAKGFHPKFSFRREPGKKKRNRKKK